MSSPSYRRWVKYITDPARASYRSQYLQRNWWRDWDLDLRCCATIGAPATLWCHLLPVHISL